MCWRIKLRLDIEVNKRTYFAINRIMKFNFIEKTGSYIPEPENYRDVLELIKSDYFRMVGRKDSFIKMFLYTFYEPSFKFMFWHRTSALKSKNLLWFISKLLHRRYMFKYVIMITSSTKIDMAYFRTPKWNNYKPHCYYWKQCKPLSIYNNRL